MTITVDYDSGQYQIYHYVHDFMLHDNTLLIESVIYDQSEEYSRYTIPLNIINSFTVRL